MPRRKNNSCSENWTNTEVLTLIKRNANEALKEVKKKEEGHKIVFIPHPTIPKTLIQKII